MTLVDDLVMPPREKAVVATIRGIGTAIPGGMAQDRAIELAEELSGADSRQKLWLRRVFEKSGVLRRSSVLIENEAAPLEDLKKFYRNSTGAEDRGPGTAARMMMYARKAPVLAAEAAREALTMGKVPPRAVTHLLTASCTGFMAPGLDAELIEKLGLRRDISRMHVGFMGCHAAFNVLEMAQGIVRGDPSAVVLVCCVELCSLHFAYGWTPEKLVANALFGDGAAAAVVGNVEACGEECWEIRRRASLLLGGSADAMRWRIGDHGFEMTLSPELPELVGAKVRAWCEEWLGEEGIAIEEVQNWAIHPGGPKILTAVRTALRLEEADLQFSRGVLAAHGNMSSATVLFILQAMANAGARGSCVALGFGPGLVMEGMLLEKRRAKSK